jgi:hypothetical protein
MLNLDDLEISSSWQIMKITLKKIIGVLLSRSGVLLSDTGVLLSGIFNNV